MKSLVTMRRALEDPELFGAILPGASWAGWRVLLIASMGEELTDAERETFKALTGREREPLTRIDELWAIIGRRGGKTRAIAVLAAYLAALVDYSDILAPGARHVPIENRRTMLDRLDRQTGPNFRYIDCLAPFVDILPSRIARAFYARINVEPDIAARIESCFRD
jgi:hypothetical protein